MTGYSDKRAGPEGLAMLRQSCARCGANPGENCRTKSGNTIKASRSHTLRWYAAVRERKAAAGRGAADGTTP